MQHVLIGSRIHLRPQVLEFGLQGQEFSGEFFLRPALPTGLAVSTFCGVHILKGGPQVVYLPLHPLGFGFGRDGNLLVLLACQDHPVPVAGGDAVQEGLTVLTAEILLAREKKVRPWIH